ncbi:hypothetical protein GCK32_021308, partial [Trichostrongylus colubriformis]
MLGTSPRPRELSMMHPDEQVWNGVLLELDDEEISNDLMRMAAGNTVPEVNDAFIPPSCSSHVSYPYEQQSTNTSESLMGQRRDMQLVDVSTSNSN